MIAAVMKGRLEAGMNLRGRSFLEWELKWDSYELGAGELDEGKEYNISSLEFGHSSKSLTILVINSTFLCVY